MRGARPGAPTGAHVVPALILAKYKAQGGPTGSLGYPTGDVQRLTGDGSRQTFEGGTITVASPNIPFVKAAYQDFLGRQPTSSELDQMASAIGRGGRHPPPDAVGESGELLQRSRERRRQERRDASP